MKCYLLLSCLVIAGTLNSQQLVPCIDHAVKHSRIGIVEPDQDVIQSLLRAGIDLHCGSRMSFAEGRKTLIVECESSVLEILNQERIAFDVFIDDVSDFYAQRAMSKLEEASDALDAMRSGISPRTSDHGCEVFQNAVPSHFRLGDLGGFLHYDEILATLDSMRILYPDLISVRAPLSDSIITHEGREVFWVRISDHADIDEPEAEVLYTSLTHAREPAGAMSLLYFMWNLLENYEHDPDIRQLVDRTEMYFIPVVNPDGYVRNAELAPKGGGMWRKNLRDNDGDDMIDGYDGVDLNRNYGYQWGYNDTGSTAYPGGSTYRGTSAFSEPETQMIRDFTLSHDFVVSMHDHSYGNDLYHAWEFGEAELPDAGLLYRTSDLMTWNNRYLFGETHSTYWLGSINGSANDWFYHEDENKPSVLSWIPEVGRTFWPDPTEITGICAGQMRTHMLAARIADLYAVVHDISSPNLEYGENTIQLSIENLGRGEGMVALQITTDHPETVSLVTQIDSIWLDRSITTISIPVQANVAVLHETGTEIQIEIALSDKVGIINTLKTNKRIDMITTRCLPEKWQSDTWSYQVDSTLENNGLCLTDSPNGLMMNELTEMSLKEPLDLSEITWASVSFLAKWSIETNYDYIQLQASTDAKTWSPLCGNYTKPGSKTGELEAPNPHAGQPAGEPVFDGRQLFWVRETVDLNDYVGEPEVFLRFVGWSGAAASSGREDGFAFSDFEIVSSRPLHCYDGVLNVDEDEVDCGGSCTRCATCDDGVQNGEEEGVDCGGTNCAPCPSCADEIQNGDETGVDCGGDACDPCPTCHDELQNGEETGIDCGGPDCNMCEPTCVDGQMNGEEEDVDCGGDCPPCKAQIIPNTLRYARPLYSEEGPKLYYYPNPASSTLHLRWSNLHHVVRDEFNPGTTSLEYFISDMNGRIQIAGDLQILEEGHIDISRLADGCYVLTIVASGDQLVKDKLIKVSGR